MEAYRIAAASCLAASIVLAMISVGYSLTYLSRQAVRAGESKKSRRRSRLFAVVLIVAPIVVAVVAVASSPRASLNLWYLPAIFLWLFLAFLSAMRLFRDYAVVFRQAARDHVSYPPILAHCHAAEGSTGTTTAESVIQSPRPERKEAEALQANVLCAGCDYNLRGLPKTCDACPECGKAFQESLYRDRLMFADRSLLRRIRKGLIVTEVGLISLPIWLISTPLWMR